MKYNLLLNGLAWPMAREMAGLSVNVTHIADSVISNVKAINEMSMKQFSMAIK
jgi:hypothetical protein